MRRAMLMTQDEFDALRVIEPKNLVNQLPNYGNRGKYLGQDNRWYFCVNTNFVCPNKPSENDIDQIPIIIEPESHVD